MIKCTVSVPQQNPLLISLLHSLFLITLRATNSKMRRTKVPEKQAA